MGEGHRPSSFQLKFCFSFTLYLWVTLTERFMKKFDKERQKKVVCWTG